MTAHRLLYKSVPRADGSFIHIPKDSISDYDIIVVDEVSMLPKPMWNLLLSHGIYVIACGDPGQLPPIGEENGILEHPHIFLDEIMRQAAESEIIRLSADIRAGKIIKPYKGSEINVVRQRDLCDGMFTWADQILCGKNVTRHTMNNYYRTMRYGEDIPTPIVGDKVICLKNNWDKITATGDALVNGTIGTIEEIATYPNPWLNPMCIIDFAPETIDETDPRDQVFHELLMDYKLITTKEATVNKENFRMFPKQLRPEQFDYGYCITVHKSQGSEYDKVLVLEEVLKRADHARWLYTAVTRSAKKLTLVLKD